MLSVHYPLKKFGILILQNLFYRKLLSSTPKRTWGNWSQLGAKINSSPKSPGHKEVQKGRGEGGRMHPAELGDLERIGSDLEGLSANFERLMADLPSPPHDLLIVTSSP